MKEILAVKSLEDAEQEDDIDDDYNGEDLVRESMKARGQQASLSLFEFTATPKPKTLEVFTNTIMGFSAY